MGGRGGDETGVRRYSDKRVTRFQAMQGRGNFLSSSILPLKANFFNPRRHFDFEGVELWKSDGEQEVVGVTLRCVECHDDVDDRRLRVDPLFFRFHCWWLKRISLISGLLSLISARSKEKEDGGHKW